MKRFLLFIAVLILSFSCKERKNDKLIIATAANMQFAVKEIIKQFSEQTGVGCEIVVGSSGKLTAQIKEGAPYDVFISADMKYPKELFNSGFTNEKAKTYAYGKLVLWTMNDEIIPSIDSLTSKNIKHIAIANPKMAPYGIAAKESLEYYNIFDKIESKLVFGESISQTNRFITSNAAQIGLTAKSVVLSPQMKGKGNWIEIDTKTYSPIAQGIVILKNKRNNSEKANQFYNFIFSNKGKNVLINFGYLIDEQIRRKN